MVLIDTNGVKEPSINSTRRLNIIFANQVSVMDLIIDAKLKQSSKIFVYDVRLSISPSIEVFGETHVFYYHGQEERARLFLCQGDSDITDWVHQLLKFEG